MPFPENRWEARLVLTFYAAAIFSISQDITTENRTNRSDEGLRLETAALESLHNGQIKKLYPINSVDKTN